MLALRWIVAHRRLPLVLKTSVSSPCVTSLTHLRPCGSLQHRFLSSGRNSSAPTPKAKLATRLLVTVLFGGGVLAAWWYVHEEKKQMQRQQRVEQLRQLTLGRGNFSLLDHRGQRRTKHDFLALPQVQPLFITVDPERDDVAAVARYIKDFHPRLIGLTGTLEEVKEAGQDFRVYSSAGPKDEDGDYIVDHTVLIYLISPDGLLLDYYNRTKNEEQMVENIRNHIRTYCKKKS
uniref:Synthesis of cytochrome C oxidase 2 n=1 Tax=Cynoglossus semilaevis TaxID=244447 RepID=A0A3P8UZW4_CYNSE